MKIVCHCQSNRFIFQVRKKNVSPCFYYNVNIIEILFAVVKSFSTSQVMKPLQLLLLMLTSRLELPNSHLNIFEQDWMSVRVKEESNLFHITTIAKDFNGNNKLSSSSKVDGCNIKINWNLLPVQTITLIFD